MVVLRSFLLGLVMLGAVQVLALEATVTPDRTEVQENETFNVEFAYNGKLDSEPDFSAIESNFRIVSQNRRSNLAYSGGSYQYELSWVLTLLPKSTGDLNIPAITFDQAQSPEVIIKVSAAPTASQDDLGDVFLETELTPVSSYVQGEYIFTVRVYIRGWVVDLGLSEPDVGSQDVVIQSLGEPKRYSKFRNGDRYQVYERRHALFPQSSGALTIEPTYFSGRLRLPSGRNLLKRLTGDGHTVEVKPSPATFSGANWLPAKNIELEEIWPSETLVFEQGVPITRTLVVKASGLSSAQLPQLEIDSGDQVRIYPGAPTTQDRLIDSGVQGVRTESVAIVPQQSGDLVLPAVEVVWWDTVNDREQVARIPERTISVAPGAVAAATDTTRLNVGGDELATQRLTRGPFANPWFWATVLCGLGWLVTLWRNGPAPVQQGRQSSTPQSQKVDFSRQKRLLQAACASNDAAHVKAVFDHYAQALTRSPQPLNTMQIENEFGAPVSAALNELTRHLYGPDADENWRGGMAFWSLIEKHRPQEKRVASKPKLAPL